MVQAYWSIGREIVEEEQKGVGRAEYGAHLIETLANHLTAEFGRGFDVSNLRHMRIFYLTFPIRDAVRRELSWTHYRLLCRVANSESRQFYLLEAIASRWSTRELERQIHSFLYERIAASRDKEGVLRLSSQGAEPFEPSDLLRDPYVLEFTGLPEREQWQSDLEQVLMDRLQKFLLEMGRDLYLVARQKRLTIEGDHFLVDFVFYHRTLLQDPDGGRFTYSYTTLDYVESIRDGDGNRTTFAYDTANRRTTLTDSSGIVRKYAYDAVNRLTTQVDMNSLLINIVNIVDTYDAVSNRTNRNQDGVLTTWTYDSAYRLTGQQRTGKYATGSLATYTYDGDGLRRSLQESGGSLTTMIWDGSDYLMEKTATATVRYTLADSEVIAEKRGGARKLYVPDPLGSTVKLIDSTQAITDSWSYYPYGEVASRTGTTATPLQFIGTAGYYRDSSGRIYVRMRHLRTDLARWMTQDPIWFRGKDINLYRYVYSRPTNFADPSGLVDPITGIIVGVCIIGLIGSMGCRRKPLPPPPTPPNQPPYPTEPGMRYPPNGPNIPQLPPSIADPINSPIGQLGTLLCEGVRGGGAIPPLLGLAAGGTVPPIETCKTFAADYPNQVKTEADKWVSCIFCCFEMMNAAGITDIGHRCVDACNTLVPH